MRREVLAVVGSPNGYVDCAGGGDGGSITPAIRDHNKKAQQQRRPLLPMVDACIRESQRLYPVAPFVVRHLSTDLRLKDGEEGEPLHAVTQVGLTVIAKGLVLVTLVECCASSSLTVAVVGDGMLRIFRVQRFMYRYRGGDVRFRGKYKLVYPVVFDIACFDEGEKPVQSPPQR